MPTYSFVCEECGYNFEESMSMADYKLIPCPKCSSSNVYRDFKSDAVIVQDSEPRTLGMLAEKNARQLKQNN